MMLRVLHVVDSLQLGGTEWQCVSLAGHLDPSRFQNYLVSFNGGTRLVETLWQMGVPTEVIPFRGFRRLAGVKDLMRLAALMRRHRIQIVQAYGFYSNVPAIVAGRMVGVPVLVASRRDMGEFLSRTQRRVEKGIFRLADRVVVNSEAIRSELLVSGQVGERKIFLIPTGVDLRRFDRLRHVELGGDRPDWAGKGKVVAMVAMFRAAKDHANFLRAAKQILTVNPTVVFVLIGGVFAGSAVCESLKESAVQLAERMGISSSVRFLGAVDPESIPSLLQHVSVAVLASTRHEGLPNVVLEYMAAAKPVVVTDAGGCREVVLDGVTGFLVPPGDPGQLAGRIIHLLRNDGEAAKMGKAGRQRVEAGFSLARMLDRFSSLYITLAGEKLGGAVEIA
jgi:glycosyltransferase involved in cell wall biosynthesis